ncbi:MAG: helix-turn-helix domain-containing protein, partial [Chitinophagaceae bacterium]
LLFRRFAVDFAEKYKTAPIQLEEEARHMLISYPWPGNVRELKNIAEQISVLAADKLVTASDLRRFLPEVSPNRLPILATGSASPNGQEFTNEREILYKLFFDMKKDVTELKKMFLEILQNPALAAQHPSVINQLKELKVPETLTPSVLQPAYSSSPAQPVVLPHDNGIHQHEEVEESLNIIEVEKELINKALKKHKGKRKDAAIDLGISERTLYRKLKEYDIQE